MSALSADMLCGRLSSCRASTVTVASSGEWVCIFCYSWRQWWHWFLWRFL